MDTFSRILDSRTGTRKPLKIEGSGTMFTKEFWLNVRDVAGKGRERGIMRVAINNWLDYFSVR
jgi:hypothetical protein